MKTVLYSEHQTQNAYIVDFHGWEMPLWYTSIIKEHDAVRTNAGIFDVSHMGRLLFTGKDSECFLNEILTCDVRKVAVWQAKYSFVLNKNGGIEDDTILYRFPDKFILVVNASNREKILKHLEQNKGKFDIEIKDVTRSLALISLQGSKAVSKVLKYCEPDPSTMKYYRFAQGKFNGVTAILARTGYTGEHGVEIFINSKDSAMCWNELSKFATPCGLGARDSLRLEAGMPLYGNEMDEKTNPFDANLAFAVDMEKESFIGKSSLENINATKTILGITLPEEKIPRQGNKIFSGTKEVGVVTSGTFSPTFKKGIGMISILKEYTEKPLTLKQKDDALKVKVIELPFYSNTRKTPVKRVLSS